MEKSTPNPIRITANIEVMIFKLPRVTAANPAVQMTPISRLIPARRGATHIRKERMKRAMIRRRAIIEVRYISSLAATVSSRL